MKSCPLDFTYGLRDLTSEEVDSKLKECYQVLGSMKEVHDSFPDHHQYTKVWWIVRSGDQLPPPPGPDFHRTRWMTAERVLKIAKMRLEYMA